MPRVRTSVLARAFAWIGLTAIGGGRATYFYETFVVRRGWVAPEAFLNDLTLSQLLPGPTVSNLAVALGHRLRGAPGATLGVLATIVPGGLAVLAVSALYFGRGVSPGVGTALKGMGAAVVGMLLVTAARLARGALKGRGATLIAAAAFLGVGPLRLNALVVILAAGAISLWVQRPRRAGGGAPPGEDGGAPATPERPSASPPAAP